MLEVARMCPRCGKHIPDTPGATTWHLAGCRPVVYAALQEPEPRIDYEDPPVPVGRQIRDFEAPLPRARRTGPVEAADTPLTAERPAVRALAIPWLRPPDLGGIV